MCSAHAYLLVLDENETSPTLSTASVLTQYKNRIWAWDSILLGALDKGGDLLLMPRTKRKVKKGQVIAVILVSQAEVAATALGRYLGYSYWLME